jgi:tRNA dimethylallyltransferase
MSQAPVTPIPVVLIMGPTGGGKTDLALRLATRLPIEIVSVDSAMVYRGLDIGTGKPSAEVLRQYPHHLVDILDPKEAYSAGQFVRDVGKLIREIHARGHLPILVGGTMLYFRALRRGLAALPSADPLVRSSIDAQAQQIGWPAMHAELALIDARSAARIQPNDAQRIQRALEVFRISGKTLSDFHAETQAPDPTLAFTTFAWAPSDRDRLYAAIDKRFRAMLQAGLLDEVRGLHRREDLHSSLPAIRSVGYRQLWDHLEERVSLEQAIQNAIVATRHLARRQFIWLRSENELTCVDALEPASAALIEQRTEALCAQLH